MVGRGALELLHDTENASQYCSHEKGPESELLPPGRQSIEVNGFVGLD